MPSDQVKGMARWGFAAYAFMAAAVLVLLLVTVWSASREIERTRNIMLRAEIARLRSHAERVVERIEQQLQRSPDVNGLSALREAAWLQDDWDRLSKAEGERVFAAILDREHRLVLHSDGRAEEGLLETWWYERSLPEIGTGVVLTSSLVLTAGEPAWAVRVPIVNGGREAGEYHAGLSVASFESAFDAARGEIRRRWTQLFGVQALILLGTVGATYALAQRSALGRQAFGLRQVRFAAELAQLAGGLAHEIRNPLHAIRLNLHALAQCYTSEMRLPDDEVNTIVQESNREIDRVNELMRQLLDYASPGEPKNEEINLTAELQATLKFVDQVLEREKIAVEARLPSEAVHVRMDRNRFRQIILNLLDNAKEASPPGGHISVALQRRHNHLEILVADHGSGIAEEDRERIFEPFFSTKQNGTGLGLALVKHFVDEAGGTIDCGANEPAGTCFRVRLPELKRPSRKD